MKLSDEITEFLALCERVVKERKYDEEVVTRLNLKVSDLTHEMELMGTSYQERAKIATEMRKVLRERRASKDRISVNETFYNWIGINKKALDIMRSTVLGKVRETENYHENKRQYNPRVED